MLFITEFEKLKSKDMMFIECPSNILAKIISHYLLINYTNIGIKLLSQTCIAIGDNIYSDVLLFEKSLEISSDVFDNLFRKCSSYIIYYSDFIKYQ